MNQAELTGFLDRLEGIGLNDQQLLAPIIGILFDDTSAWVTLRIGELKALLLLALRHHQEAQYWCAWCLEHAELPGQRRRLFALLHTLLGFRLAGQRANEYSDSLGLLYGEEEIAAGQAIVDGQTRFPGLAFAASWSEIATKHGRLLAIYGQLSAIKEAEGRKEQDHIRSLR
jgi:ribosomal protein S12 methylthiotransferase accessory factor